MITKRQNHWHGLAVVLALTVGGASAQAEPQHGIAMYGDPALPPDFVSLPQANPDAPKGGTYRWGESGSYDSYNPYVVKGRAPIGISTLTVETLMRGGPTSNSPCAPRPDSRMARLSRSKT